VVREGGQPVSVLFRTTPVVEQRYSDTPRGIPSAFAKDLPRDIALRWEGLQIAAVVACVGLRAGAFAQLPLKDYRERNGLAEVLEPQPDLFSTPSDLVVPSVWKSQMSISRDLFGFALARVWAWDGAMYPKRADWLDPSRITHKTVGGVIEWRYDRELLDPSEVIHVPSRFVLPGDPVGTSPLQYSGLVDLAQRAQEFGRDWFRNGAVPSSIIYSDEKLTSDQATSLLETIRQRWRNRQPAVLGAGMRYEKVAVAANESQFLETCRQAAHDIAISFNLPPEKIGAAVSGQSITYANREQNQQQYLIDSINPDLVVVQESLDRHTPRGQFCKFNTGAFLRSDLKTRYEAHGLGIKHRFLTPNEARALEEMPPLDGGDEFPTVSADTPPREEDPR
jgi:HK97 family phage portal protein